MAVLIPITSPSRFTNGPPLLPGLIAASVWIWLSLDAKTEAISALDAWIEDQKREPDEPREEGVATALTIFHAVEAAIELAERKPHLVETIARELSAEVEALTQ